MVVVTLTDCPQKLRGDLTKWLMEISTGVYVGKLSARVREELWTRICENIRDGRATMTFSAQNEQGLNFYVHNTSWVPVDFEGIRLMQRPSVPAESENPSSVEQKLRSRHLARSAAAARSKKQAQEGYCVIDVETTGLDYQKDDLIEIAAVRIVDHKVADQFSALIKIDRELPDVITALTGITGEMLQKEGTPLWKAMDQFREFIGMTPIVSHNISFDRAFIAKTCVQLNDPPFRNVCKDTLTLARRKIEEISDYKLETLARYFKIESSGKHRALADCITTFRIYEKLNEI